MECRAAPAVAKAAAVRAADLMRSRREGAGVVAGDSQSGQMARRTLWRVWRCGIVGSFERIMCAAEMRRQQKCGRPRNEFPRAGWWAGRFLLGPELAGDD